MAKTKTLCCRLTQEQYDSLIKLSKKTGNDKSECVRKILDASFKKLDPAFENKEVYLQRKKVINEINHIGNNINQIVHNANMEFYTDYDKNKLFALMNKLNDIVYEKL